jgi:hypothetical protein
LKLHLIILESASTANAYFVVLGIMLLPIEFKTFLKF